MGVTQNLPSSASSGIAALSAQRPKIQNGSRVACRPLESVGSCGGVLAAGGWDGQAAWRPVSTRGQHKNPRCSTKARNDERQRSAGSGDQSCDEILLHGGMGWIEGGGM